MGRQHRKAEAAATDRNAPPRPGPTSAEMPPTRGQFRLLVASAVVLIGWLVALAVLAIRARH